MGMVPSYKTNEWLVNLRHNSGTEGTKSTSIQIRVKENDEWRDYWVPQDPANTDFNQYQEWLAEGHEPRIIL